MRTCKDCGHWRGDWDTKVAYCTLWPEWKETANQHFCGQYSSHPGPAMDRRARDHIKELYGQREHLRQRAIAAEKKLKVLRASKREA